MLYERRRENQGRNLYQGVSLPKNISKIKMTSTRCVSVSKNQKVIVSETMIGSSNNNANRVTQNVQNIPKQLLYFLGKGNNQNLIRKVLRNRATWVESDDSTNAFVNLKWQQDQKGYKYDRLIDSGLYRGVLNQFQFQECLSNKEFLFKNLEQYCHKNSIDLWKIVPPTYVLNSKDQCNMQILKQLIDSYQKYYPKKLKQKHLNDFEKDIQGARQKLKKIFFNSNLKKNLPKSPALKGTFVDQDGQFLWIVKPTFLNRGRGIQVFSKLQQLYKFVNDNICGYFEKSLSKIQTEPEEKTVVDYIKRNSEQISATIFNRDPNNRQIKQRRQSEVLFDGNQYIRVIPRGPALIKTDRFLIQKYLEKPLLMLNRKFDIRIWVLVTQNMKGYVFKEGYVRLSSMEYSCKDSKDNTFVHLTNNAVQKFSEGYGEIADGNQLSFKQLKDLMKEKALSFDECKQTINEHIKVSLQACTKHLNPLNRKFTFQIFGYDFMIDQNGHPFLIEVNNNPCIEESSKLLAALLPRMIDDAFRLTIDPLFYGSVSNGKYPVDGYNINENMWLNLQINPDK